MITTFDTSVAPSNNTGSGNSNALLWVAVIGLGLFLGYKFIIKPELDKQKANEQRPQ